MKIHWKPDLGSKERNAMLTPTYHALTLSAQRNLPIDAVDYILDHGKAFHTGGVVVIYLRDHDIPTHDRQFPQIARLAGTALVLSLDKRTIITIWRDRKNGMKYLKRKNNSYPKGNPFFLYQ